MDFLGILSGLGAAVDIGTNLWKTKYNYDMNQRDFDYQKSLQEQIFQREDTAVQRRMADLQAAGLNPNLAAGSAAGAGSVVSRSSTNDLNPGSVLDSLMALNQIKMQKQEVENKKLESDILKTQKSIYNQQDVKSRLEMLNLMDWDTDIYPVMNKDGSVSWQFVFDGNSKNTRDMPLFKTTAGNLRYLEDSNKYLDKELKWQTAEKFADMVAVGSNFVPKVNFGFRR